MNTMMDTLGSPSPLVFSLWLIHWVGGTLWIMGAVLFVVWAVKYLSPEHLRSLGLWTFVVGLLISVLTASAAAQGMQWLLSGGHGMSSGDTNSTQSMMEEMMRHDDSNNALLHSEHELLLRPQSSVQPDGPVTTAPRRDAAPANPDHLMPDGSMMDSRSM